MSEARPIEYCPDCQAEGQRGSCAPRRCYCGHEPCPAFASYIKPQASTAVPSTATKTNPHAESWANREEDTWLDKL